MTDAGSANGEIPRRLIENLGVIGDVLSEITDLFILVESPEMTARG